MHRFMIPNLITIILLMVISIAPSAAQNVRVGVGKSSTLIPKGCENVFPAAIEGTIDIPALTKEAICKGSGDMLIDYTYVMKHSERQKDKKGQIKEETTTYEVFIPTLKSGVHTRGILLVTNRNGVPVPPAELEKAQQKAGEALEKEENRIARLTAPPAETNANRTTGTAPVGMYTNARIDRGAFGFRRGGAALGVQMILKTCELILQRREQLDGRETMVFTFFPSDEASFGEDDRYIARIFGEVWIDVKDRIVTRLVGWPMIGSIEKNKNAPPATEEIPAVFIDMTRLPEGVWLPHTTRLNGADYPKLFDRIDYDTTFTSSDYRRLQTEVKDVKVGAPNPKP